MGVKRFSVAFHSVQFMLILAICGYLSSSFLQPRTEFVSRGNNEVYMNPYESSGWAKVDWYIGNRTMKDIGKKRVWFTVWSGLVGNVFA